MVAHICADEDVVKESSRFNVCWIQIGDDGFKALS